LAPLFVESPIATCLPTGKIGRSLPIGRGGVI
jgi:hypothetical protein